MSRMLLGYQNAVLTGAPSAGSQAAGLSVSNLQTDICSPSTAWQTAAGVLTPAAGAWFTIDAGSPSAMWRVFLLARTNLTPAATVRWRVGPSSAFGEVTPTIDINYAQLAVGASPPSGYSFTRASVGYCFNSSGVLTQVAANTLRHQYDPATLAYAGALKEEARTNGIRNPRAEGATVGTPGVMPTNWSYNFGNGVSCRVVAISSEAGIPYIDLRYTGTVSATSDGGLTYPEIPNLIVAALGETWTASMYLRVIAGATTGFVPQVDLLENDASGSFLGATGTLFAATGAALATQRASHTRQLSQTGVLRVQPVLLFNCISGTVVDLTLRIGAPQIEKASVASSPILPTAGAPAATTRAADVEKITGLSIAAGSGYTVFVDGTSLSAAATQWGMMPASGTQADSAYLVQQSSGNEFLTQGNSVGGAGPSPTKSASVAVRNKTAVVSGGGTAAVAVAGSLGTILSGSYTSNGNMTTMAFGCSPWASDGQGLALYQRITFYNQRLTNAQAGTLSSGGVLDNVGASYDSGTIPAGIVAGFGQAVFVLPAAVSGQFFRCDISDPGNPDGFINVPGAYAGPAWQPDVGLGPASSQGRDDSTAETTTRGGQEYPVTYWRRRRWEIDLQGVKAAEVWANLDVLDSQARLGTNLLLVPDTASATIAREAVFGRIRPKADISYPTSTGDLRTWRASITERL